MNNRLSIGFAYFVSLSMLLFGASSVLAKTDIIPGGPWITDNQNVNLNAFRSY